MTFRAIVATPGSNEMDVCVSVQRRPGKAERVRVSVSATIARELGWTEGMGIEPMHGEDSDRGLIKLRPAAKRGFKFRPVPGATRFSLDFKGPRGTPTTYPREAADYRLGIVDRSLTIRLPWAQKPSLRAAG